MNCLIKKTGQPLPTPVSGLLSSGPFVLPFQPEYGGLLPQCLGPGARVYEEFVLQSMHPLELW